MINFFVEKGVNLKCIDYEGKNILHKYLECVNANEDGIKLLIDAGINPNQLCNKGNNPLLHYVSKPTIYHSSYQSRPKMEIIYALIEVGIDINSVNHKK
jgi:hypothetical protein